MIKEGLPTVTLRFLAENPSKLAISNFSDVQIQGANIRHYYNYLLSRAKAYRDTHLDWVREGKGRLKRQSVEKGLLRETESVQRQIATLLKCDLFSSDTENEITLTAFRLLTVDLLSLFHIMNEGTIGVLERYFEMSRVDAERALAIYKTFSRQTDEVVTFLSVARQYESATRLEIPKLKHAPTSLTSSLEEYLNDPDFEINRRQYLAQQEAKKGNKSKGSSKVPVEDFKKMGLNNGSSSKPTLTASASKPPEAKGPAPDLIDFFESIEQNQQPMVAPNQTPIQNLQAVPQYQFQQPPQFTGFQTQQPQPGQTNSTNPFANMVSPQETQGFAPSTASPFGMQAPAQGFGTTTMSNQLQQSQSNQFQQQSPFSNGQISSAPNLGQTPQQQSAFSAPIQQQPFNTGQTQGSTSSQQLQAFSTGPSMPQATNPFRQSVMPQMPITTSTSTLASPPPSLGHQSTNPFQHTLNSHPTMQSQQAPVSSPATSVAPSIFSPQTTQSPQSFTSAASQPLQPFQPVRTGTNPFARSSPAPPPIPNQPPAPLAAQATGTNPFRQSAFVNQATGQGWQAHQGTMGGLEQLNTIPVFPRPVGQTPFQTQPQPQQQPWP